MKNLKFFLLAAGIVISAFSFAQTKEEKKQAKQAAVKQLVESQHYTFVAQYANPIGGSRRYLNSDYDLKVRKDSVIAYLPYFGRAHFDAGYGSSNDSGIKFTSTKFTYTATASKKGGWDVVIKPSDVKYVTAINMSISADGYINTRFTITNKSAISFDGVLKEREAKK
ncbi:DUF4251 domain-containing protein [Mucilaginibacter jinjuensis]|uniref:DUF4251 domain-containing protein n=1 Tax=Mucilaginibacter jinjuensis TaxID=1176721 RepID=A0ABY7TG32_9SPHI|nr:DUF4251 domain-containing protein [Mucilaginibacter jinjuensis]WCT14950.1 DUF4251 domain-containing protein [Mucilaginibacter jinjuensis]